MDKQALNKKLAEWAGIPLNAAIDFGIPSSQDVYEPPNFTQSLNDCYKWLVPKIQISGDIISLQALEQKGYSVCIASMFANEPYIDIRNIDSPSLALCLAIEKLIDSKGDK